MAPTPGRRPALIRSELRHFSEVTTRWTDNDVYGHVNNAIYYEYFDSAVNRYLTEVGTLDIHGGSVIGLVVESSCRYHAPLAYPERLEVGVRVDRLGTSSVTYGVAVFALGADAAAADGTFIHVFVDRTTRRPTPIPERLRTALQALQVEGTP